MILNTFHGHGTAPDILTKDGRRGHVLMLITVEDIPLCAINCYEFNFSLICSPNDFNWSGEISFCFVSHFRPNPSVSS